MWLTYKTPDLVISYTGDIRLHGYRENDTLNFCKESEGCDVLLIEGVSVSFQEFDEDVSDKEISNEPELLDKINEIVKNNPDKQITFNYYISNFFVLDFYLYYNYSKFDITSDNMLEFAKSSLNKI